MSSRPVEPDLSDPATVALLNSDPALWSAIDDYWTGEASVCPDCPNYSSAQESRGEFWGRPCSETVNSCAVMDGVRTSPPISCLAFQLGKITLASDE